MTTAPRLPSRQTGMALIITLVFLLVLTLLGVSSMQNATVQEKMAGSTSVRNQSFQFAEAALRIGESKISVDKLEVAQCATTAQCAPPPESSLFPVSGTNSVSGVNWVRVGENAVYGVQNIGTSATPINRPPNCAAPKIVTLYRVTAAGKQGASTTVLESIYVKC